MRNDQHHGASVRIGLGGNDYSFRWDDSLIIVLALRGVIDVSIGCKDYRVDEDEIIVVNCEDMHSLKRKSEDCVYLLCSIDVGRYNKYINHISSVLYFCKPSIYTEKQKRLLPKLQSKLVDMYISQESGSSGVEMDAQAIELLDTLAYNFNSIGKSPDSYKSVEQAQRMWIVFDYIYENYHKKLPLTEVASFVHVNETYLSRQIKGSTGATYEEWLSIVRTEYSLKPLLTTAKSISGIAELCGFSDVKYFNKAFKKNYGLSPKDFRDNYAINSDDYRDCIFDVIRKGIDEEAEVGCLKQKMDSYKSSRQQIYNLPTMNLAIFWDQPVLMKKASIGYIVNAGDHRNLEKPACQKAINGLCNEIALSGIKVYGSADAGAEDGFKEAIKGVEARFGCRILFAKNCGSDRLDENAMNDSSAIAAKYLKKWIQANRPCFFEVDLFDAQNENLSFGGTGLFTLCHIKKPIYYALFFYQKLAEDIVFKNEYCAIGRSGDEMQFLAFNLPATANDGNIIVCLKIKKLINNEFTVVRYQYDDAISNMNNHVLNPKAVHFVQYNTGDYIMKNCEPRVTIDYIENTDEVELECEVRPYGIEFIIVKKVAHI